MNLRNFCVLILLSLFAIGCTNASKAFKKGQYDDAINRCIQILQKEPTNQKYLEILRDAYRIADANDKERILTLKGSGQPDIWGSTITIYERMIARNRRIDALPSSAKNEIEFVFYSHSNELTEAKRKATEYHYAEGIRRLNFGTRTEARQAFTQFERVVVYSGIDYRDVRNLMARAEELGTTFVLFRVVNNSPTYLPHEAVWHLINIQPQVLNKRWVKYDTDSIRPNYHFDVVFSLDRTILFPPAVNTRSFTETRTITDGTEFQTDSRGNPVQDSAGNFIRIPRNITLKCVVTEVTQSVQARLDGTMTYFDVETQRFLRSIPLSRTFTAHSSSFRTDGDLRALSDQTRKRITAPVMPLPAPDQMLVWAAQDMTEMIRETLSANSNLMR